MDRKPNTLKYFIWGYQPHFRICLGVNAKDLFSKLAPELIPEVTIVGKLAEDDPEAHPVCPEPEEAYDINIFKNLDTTISEIADSDPEKKIWHSHSIAAENHQTRMKKRWIKDGIIKVLSESDVSGLFFGSFPQRVNNYEVVVVLRFDRELYESFYSLKIDTVNERYKIARSFIESSIREFLDAAEEALMKPNPGPEGIDRPKDELLRSAAKNLMLTPSWYGGNTSGLHGLYDAVNGISLSRYEGSDAAGRLLIARRDHPNIKTVVNFLNPAKLAKARSIRKLLETSSDSLALLTDSYEVYGLGVQEGDYDSSKEDLYEIQFTKRHAWYLLHAKNILMKIEDGTPQLPKEKVCKEKILLDLKRLFPKNSVDQNMNIYELIECASNLRHGTMLVISNKADTEAARLGNQSTPITPIKLNKNLIFNLTTIDGAILLSPDGTCHAIGVVLDGMASPKGDPARGARYNSALRYIAVNPNSLAVVISEDGTVDLVPNLRPQFPRSEIDYVIEKANKLLSEQNPDEGDISKLIQWLESYSFYLLDADCEVGNKLIESLDKMPSEVCEIRIKYNPFKKHEEMNETYYE
jgi:hypothetical protein